MNPLALPIRSSSAWDASTVEQFLHTAVIPMRLGCIGEDDAPMVVSLWFTLEHGRLWCALHESAALLRYLRESPICGFEIAGDGPPYYGVRGQARSVVVRERGASVLDELLARYGVGTETKLGKWLRSRADDEFAVALEPLWITAWDYRERMTA